MLISRDGVVFALATIDASSEGIHQIMWMMNPAKLAAISRSSPESSEGHSSDASFRSQ